MLNHLFAMIFIMILKYHTIHINTPKKKAKQHSNINTKHNTPPKQNTKTTKNNNATKNYTSIPVKN